jgi:hypothetical protein
VVAGERVDPEGHPRGHRRAVATAVGASRRVRRAHPLRRHQSIRKRKG